MELEQYVSVFKRWWWLMVACVAVATGSSYYGTSQMPRIYQATTTVMVGQTLEQADPRSSDLYISQQLAETYAEMVKRRPVLESAAEALGLSYVPSGGSVSTRQVAGTQLLEISFRDTNPERARVIADEIANQLVLRSPSASVDQDRRAFVEDQLVDLEEKIAAAEAEVEDEQQKLEAANSARAIQQYQANINALEQKLSSYRSTYASLVTGVRGGTNFISIIEPATTPRSPISPDVEQTVMLAAVIGLTLAVGGAFLIEYMDDTIKTPDDVESTVDLPTLGAILAIDGETYPDKLIAAREPRSPVVEAYRALRTNLQFSSVDRLARALMVTSPNPTEGKSVTLANLAVVMAQAGLRVIVVDSDLRRPVLHKLFSLSYGRGLSEAVFDTRLDRASDEQDPRSLNEDPARVLTSRNSGLHGPPRSDRGLKGYLQTTRVANLRVLPCGPVPPNPAELLGSQRMGRLVEELKAQADVVLFDSPPVLAVTDAAVLSTQVDGVLMVINAGGTRREAAERAVEELHRVGANLLGVVLNRLSRGVAGYYYHDYYRREDGKGEKQRRSRRRSKTQRPTRLTGPSGNGKGETGAQTAQTGAMDLWLRRREADVDDEGSPSGG